MMDDVYNEQDLKAQANAIARRPRALSPKEVVKISKVDETLVDNITVVINTILSNGGHHWDIPTYRTTDTKSIELTINKVMENYTKAGWKVDRITERRPNGRSYLTFAE